MERVNCVSDGVTGGRVGCKRVTRGVGCVSDRVVKQVGCLCDGMTGGVGCDILTRSGVGCIGDRVTVTGWVEGGDRETGWIVITSDRIIRRVGGILVEVLEKQATSSPVFSIFGFLNGVLALPIL